MKGSTGASRYKNGHVQCSFCGNWHSHERGGEWIGVAIIVCCEPCATTRLVTLMADSLPLHHRSKTECTMQQAEKALQAAAAPFRRAIANRLNRELGKGF